MAVMGLPLVVRTARAGFEQITRRYEQMAETLGAGPWRVFFTISLPLASRTVLAGALLGFSRALGEFGATIVIAGNIPGETRTIAVAMFGYLETGRDRDAAWLLVGFAGDLVRIGVVVEPAVAARASQAGAAARQRRTAPGAAVSAVRIDLAFTLEQDGFVLEIDHHADSRVLALFGPSGSGKTTCLEAIAGLRVPARGRIAIAGRELYESNRRLHLPPRLRGVGYVPQDALLFPHLDVRGNVLFGAARTRAHGKDSRVALEEVLAIVEAASLLDRRGTGALGRGTAARRAGTGADVLARHPAARRAIGGRRAAAAPPHRCVPRANS